MSRVKQDMTRSDEWNLWDNDGIDSNVNNINKEYINGYMDINNISQEYNDYYNDYYPDELQQQIEG